MRTLTITREKRLNGAGARYYILINGKNQGYIENGKTVSVNMDSLSRKIKVFADLGDGRHWSGDYTIPSGQMNVRVFIYRKTWGLGLNDIFLDIT